MSTPHDPRAPQGPRAVTRSADRLPAGAAALLAAMLLTAAVLGGLLAAAAPARAEGSSSGRISHVQPTGSGYSVVLDVPADVTPDLSGVTATLGGVTYPARAVMSKTQARGDRTAVLAIDTSDSMGTAGRFAAAKQAARTFAADAPGNVAIGIVTFDSEVRQALAPTLDRARVDQVLGGLSLSKGTRLYDGVLKALDAGSGAGQRTVIVLSDGADTASRATLDQVVSAEKAGGAAIDVVALTGADTDAVRAIAGDGQVISADDGALVKAFADEAAVLQRQVSIDISVPAADRAALNGSTTSVAVSVPSDGGTLSASAAVLADGDPGGASSAPADTLATAADQPLAAPSAATGPDPWLKFAGVLLVFAGLAVALVLLVPGRARALSPVDRVLKYTQVTGGSPINDASRHEDPLDSAKRAAADLLSRNRSLEQRISARLDGAGSNLKPSEWVLVHAGVFVAATLVGLLISRGNPLLTLLFMALGAIGPWVFLGLMRSRRRRAFDAALPDTLQLMAGSLSAGLSLGQSVDTVAREGAEPVASEFRRVLVETRLGVSIEDAFDGLATRFASEDFAWVVMAIRIQRQVGGNLAELLDTVAETMREREYVRRQVAALAAEGKLSAVVLGALPPVFLVFLLITNRTYVMPLFTDPRGWIMLAGGAVLLSVGIFSMSRLVKVEV